MKYLNYPLLALALSLAACQKDTFDEVEPPVEEPISSVQVSISDDFCGNKLSTAAGEIEIDGGECEMQALSNDNVQTFVVNDGENVFLMARTPLNNTSNIVLDAQSTALALVTMYPLFSPVNAEGYPELVSLITSSDRYPALLNEVEKSIDEKRNIYDIENESLLKAFNNLIEDLCVDAEDEVYGDSLAVIANRNLMPSRATYESPRLDPTYIDADITGNTLTLRAVGLTPTYFGTVSIPGGRIQDLALRSRNDFGGMDLFTKTVGNWRYGDPTTFGFTTDGEHHFEFSRMTPEATADFYLRLANCLLCALGIEMNGSLVEIGNSISRAMINAGSGVNDRVIDPMAWIGIAYDAILQQISSGNVLGMVDVSDSFIFGARFLAGSLNWYNRIKGIGNAATRVAFSLSAPETFDFCLCYYDNLVSTCSVADLRISAGNNQIGYANQKLIEPISVYVSSFDENGMPVESSNYHRVKFEISEGGGKLSSELVTVGSDHIAAVDWTLGESTFQEVRAVVVDIITEKEISDPVYFKASLEKAEVTVRLDWSQHSGDTDIDLHVVDPNGEEIYFAHPYSASGGYLDRDDTHGPGPEHIHWDNAPAGTYKIYVHYYPNQDDDKSVVRYTVTVNAAGVAYRPKSGSISYDQMIPVGQFTVGAESRSIKPIDHPTVTGNKVPKKVSK